MVVSDAEAQKPTGLKEKRERLRPRQADAEFARKVRDVRNLVRLSVRSTLKNIRNRYLRLLQFLNLRPHEPDRQMTRAQKLSQTRNQERSS